jgi:hypothetical protein
MISITNNYFADLKTAIDAGLFPANSKPKKTALYDAIAAHNADQPAQSATPPAPLYLDPQNAEPQPTELETLKAAFDEAQRDYQFGFASGDLKAQQAAAKRRAKILKQLADLKKPEVDQAMIEARQVRQAAAVDITALEAAGDEDAVQAALLAMDAEMPAPAPKAPKAKRIKAKPGERKSRDLTAELPPLKPFRQPKAGSKAEQEINLLRAGATQKEMMEALGWERWHWKFSAARNYGYGLRRTADGRCFLVEPGTSQAI